MSELFTDFADGELDEEGVTLERFADALTTWAFMHGGDMPVLQAASAFNTDAATIRKAVAVGPWLFIMGPDDDPSKQTIGVDGE